jgi:Fic family protein
LDKIFENINYPITQASVKELHRELMSDSRQWDDESFYRPGEYKFRDNYVMRPTGKYIKFVSPEDVPIRMDSLIQEINSWHLKLNQDDLKNHPLHLSVIFHVQFTNIHPFDDGNGRIARLVSNLLLFKKGYPPFVVNEKHREIYLGALYKATDDEEYEPLTRLFACSLIESLQSKINYFHDLSTKDGG